MPQTHPSSAPSATQKAAIYAASCNPPRRAKRIRVDNVVTDVSTRATEATATTSSAGGASVSTQQLTTPSAQSVRIRPALHIAVPTSIAPARAISPAEPVLPAPSGESTAVGPKKRGRKPGAMSRSARETQRKINHSRIEKARRSKINDALDALRALVPPDFGKEKEAEDVAVDVEQSTKSGNKKEEKEREFKLDILERTVLFVQDLMERLSRLESGPADQEPCNCRPSSTLLSRPPLMSNVALGVKRKYTVDDDESLSIASVGGPDDDDDEGDDDCHREVLASSERSSLPIERSSGRDTELQRRNARSTENVRLPSISNLLNHTPSENLPYSRSGTQSVHGSPYAPFGPHIYSTTVHVHSPTSTHPANSTTMSRRASTSSSVLAFSPSFHACSTDRKVVGSARELMSPLALGLPSPPASGSTNPHLAHVNQADPGPPPALKLPSPRGSPSEMQKDPLPASASVSSRPHAAASGTRPTDRIDGGDSVSRWQPTSPSWTREDESVASLLLQISSTSSGLRSDSSSASPPIVRVPVTASARALAAQGDIRHHDGRAKRPPLGSYREDPANASQIPDDITSSHSSLEVQTPGQLLGIRTKLS